MWLWDKSHSPHLPVSLPMPLLPRRSISPSLLTPGGPTLPSSGSPGGLGRIRDRLSCVALGQGSFSPHTPNQYYHSYAELSHHTAKSWSVWADKLSWPKPDNSWRPHSTTKSIPGASTWYTLGLLLCVLRPRTDTKCESVSVWWTPLIPTW